MGRPRSPRRAKAAALTAHITERAGERLTCQGHTASRRAAKAPPSDLIPESGLTAAIALHCRAPHSLTGAPVSVRAETLFSHHPQGREQEEQPQCRGAGRHLEAEERPGGGHCVVTAAGASLAKESGGQVFPWAAINPGPRLSHWEYFIGLNPSA